VRQSFQYFSQTSKRIRNACNCKQKEGKHVPRAAVTLCRRTFPKSGILGALCVIVRKPDLRQLEDRASKNILENDHALGHHSTLTPSISRISSAAAWLRLIGASLLPSAFRIPISDANTTRP